MTEKTQIGIPESPLPEDGLGDRVRDIREQKKLTHDGLSSLTKLVDPEGRGISRTTLRGYELRTYRPGAREIRILCSALDVTPTWLVLGKNDPGTSTPTDPMGKAPTAVEKRRWSSFAFLFLAYSQLGVEERKQIAGLVQSMYRLKVGEMKARQSQAVVTDVVDVLQDFFLDHHEKGLAVDAKALASLLSSITSDIRQRHGSEEAELVLALLSPLIAFQSKQTTPD